MGKYSGSSGGDENLVINLTVSGKETAEKEVKSFINALNTMLKGAGKYNINDYFDSAKSSIEAVRDSLRTFLLDLNNADRAADFLKSYNSYIAQFDGSLAEAADHIKSEFGEDLARRAKKTFDSVVAAAENAAPAIASVFDKQQLRDYFSSFTYIVKELGIDVSKLFNAVTNGDTSALRERIDELTGALENAEWRIVELENKIKGLGETAANAKLKQFEKTALAMTEEFQSLLSANGVSNKDFFRFSSYFEKIQQGTLTVREAFAQAKKEFGDLFSTPIGNTGLEDALARIEAKIVSMSGGGTGPDALAGLEENANTGTEAIKRETIALEEMNGKAAGLEALIDALRAIAESMKESGDSSATAFESINRLVESIQKLGDVDETKLERIATIMSSLRGAGEVKVGAASTDNLIRLVSSIDNIGNGRGINTLRGLASIDFTRLSKLKVSKAALSNLATYLPAIEKVDVSNLERLSKIDLSGIKLTKGAISGLLELSGSMNSMARGNGGDGIIAPVKVEPDQQSVQATIDDIRDRVARAGMGTKVTIGEVEMLPEAREAMARMFAYSNRPLDDNGNRIGFDPGAIEQIDALANAVASLRTNAQSLSEDIISSITFTEQSSQLAEDSIRRMAENIKTALLNGYDVSSYVKAIRDELNAANEFGLTIEFDPNAFDAFVERARVIDAEASKAKEGIASLYGEVNKAESARIISANIEEGLSRAESGARGLSDAFASVRDKQEAVVDGMSKIESTTTPANIEAGADAAKEEAAAIEGIGQATENVSEKFNTFQNILQMFSDATATISSVRTAIDELVASITALNDQLNAVDLNKLGAISGNVSAVAEGRPTESIPVEIDVESAKAALSKIGMSLDELKAKIAETFDLSAARNDAEVLAKSFGEVRESLELIRDLSVAAVKASKQANDAKKTPQDQDVKKETDELERQTEAAWKDYEAWKALEEKKAKHWKKEDWKLADAYDKEGAAIDKNVAAMERDIEVKQKASQVNRDFAQAVADMENGIFGGGEGEEIDNLSRLIILLQQYYAALTKVENARASGNSDSEARYTDIANIIESLIDDIVRENEALLEQAEATREVQSAMNSYADAADKTATKLNSNAMKQHEKAVQDAAKAYDELKSKLDSLTLDSPSIKFAGNATMSDSYQKALLDVRAAILAVERASDAEKEKAIANAQQKMAVLEKLKAEYNREATDIGKLQAKLNSLGFSSPKTTFGGNAESVERYTRAIEDAQAKINAIQGTTGAAREAAINAANDAIASVQNLNKELNKQETVIAKHKTLWESLADGWRRFGGWSIVTRSFTKIISIMRDTVNAVKEVDAAMTELKKVTDLTQKGYNEFFTEAQTIATSVGSKLSDVVRAAGDFARLGFGIEDATALAKAATLYMNIGDGIESINEASESLISTMKAFKIEAADAMSIVDMFNEVNVTCLHI